MTTILILDDDLGFTLWLGQALSASNCRALPATNVTEAAALIGHFSLMVDLVILNPCVPGGAEFTRTLRTDQGRLRVATLDVDGNDLNRRGALWPVLTRHS